MMIKTKLVLITLIVIATHLTAQVQVDKFSGDAIYGLPLITVPNFRGPSVSTSIFYRSDIKVNQAASEVGLGWDIHAGGSIERQVNGVVDDWKAVDVPDGRAFAFLKHLGSLYLNESNTSAKVLDFDYTRFKMDTLNDTIRYYYPNYDSYFVNGVGMDGRIVPENYDFSTVGVEAIDSFYLSGTAALFKYKTHFRYKYDMYDEVNATYYPWDESPITSSTKVYIPSDTVGTSNTTFDGSGYNDENYSVTANRNRTRTARYIEYFTNEEIDAGVSQFMEYDTTFDRSVEADFPQDGIGAFRITDANGYTYHYSLPVYTHYNITGNASLDKNYNVLGTTGTSTEITDATKGYAIKDDVNLEVKQNKKYAIRWLLTAITGPDFVDVNSNGIVDTEDQGYWVNYDYALWVNSFINAFPSYGAGYGYLSNIQETISDRYRCEDDAEKNPDKTLAYSETADQVYYLNHIQTPSHTAIFARDLRYDEQSKPYNYGATIYDGGDIDNDPDSVYIDEHVGSLRFINGSVSSGATVNFTLLIEPDGYETSYDMLDLDIGLPHGASPNVGFDITVYDGTTTSGTVLLEADEGDMGANYSVTASSSAALIKVTINPWYDTNKSTWDGGMAFDADWTTYWDNALPGWSSGRQKTIPQLKLSNVLLFDNNDLSSLPTLSAIDTLNNDLLWDYDSLNRSAVYNGDWYRDNQSEIDSLAIQSVAFSQDYSLAKKYDNNRYVLVNTNSRSTTAIDVEDNKYVDTTNTDSSGKLTLNKVIYYDLNGEQTQPSYLFDYNASNTTDNPDYNTLLQDYWGNYKSDGDTNLLRGYVTANSKDQTDAWSLRTITNPLGGTTEIIYESDEYEQVLSEDKGGDLRGPIKIFALKDVVADEDSIGVEWTFDLENQATEFWNLYDNLPVGAIHHTVIPCIWVDKGDSYPATGDFDYDSNFLTEDDDMDNYWGAAVSFGTGVLKESTLEVDSLNYYELNGVTSSYAVTAHPLADADSLAYAGGGYVAFQYPVGEHVYGGGTRVKELKVSNGSATYTKSYTYDEGTATTETGHFSKGKQKKSCYDYGSGSCEYWYDWGLTSYDVNLMGINPTVGYGEVTVENKGEVASGEGASVYTFHVSNEGKNYLEPYMTIDDSTWNDSTDLCCTGEQCDPQPAGREEKRFAVEVIDDFSTIWGKLKTEVFKDLHGKKVGKKLYEYTSSTKGANVSTYDYSFYDETANCMKTTKSIVCIFRSYPYYLSKVTTYASGRTSISEIEDRDPFTAEPIATQKTSINGTVVNTEKTLAYTQTSAPDYEMMGAKSDDPSYDNLLNSLYAAKNLKTSEELTTSDFLSYGKSFWKQVAKTRYYDDSDDEYTFRTDSVEWHNYVNYGWAGDLGEYGLFDNTAFSDITSPPTGASDWRIRTEITLLDEEQNVLEQKEYNDRFSASKLGYENRFKYTSGSNSNYVSFTATGFETETEVEADEFYYEGEVHQDVGCACSRLQVDGSVDPHTGNYMLKLADGGDGGVIYTTKFDTAASDSIYSLQRGRTYTASVWVHQNSVAATMLTIELDGDDSGGSYYESDTMSLVNTAAIQIGDWVQLTVNLEVPSDFTSNSNGQGLKVYVDKPYSGDAWIDDLQFKSRVTGSGMNVYDQRTGRVMATLSDNNFATKYVYNDAGQVTEVWKEVLTENNTLGKWVKVESKTIHFQREMEQ